MMDNIETEQNKKLHPLPASIGGRSRIMLASLGGVLFAAFVLSIYGVYPVLVVGSRIVSAQEFQKQYNAALLYVDNAKKVYGESKIRPMTQGDIKQSVLQGFVEASLVHDGASAEVGAGNLAGIVSQKIANLGDIGKLDNELAAIYGLHEKDFEAAVLIPQAEKDILTGRLFAKGTSYDDWLRSTESHTRVYLFVSGFKWNGTTVQKIN